MKWFLLIFLSRPEGDFNYLYSVELETLEECYILSGGFKCIEGFKCEKSCVDEETFTELKKKLDKESAVGKRDENPPLCLTI